MKWWWIPSFKASQSRSLLDLEILRFCRSVHRQGDLIFPLRPTAGFRDVKLGGFGAVRRDAPSVLLDDLAAVLIGPPRSHGRTRRTALSHGHRIDRVLGRELVRGIAHPLVRRKLTTQLNVGNLELSRRGRAGGRAGRFRVLLASRRQNAGERDQQDCVVAWIHGRSRPPESGSLGRDRSSRGP